MSWLFFYFEIYNICTSSVGSIHAMVNKASYYFMQLIVVDLPLFIEKYIEGRSNNACVSLRKHKS